MEQAEMEEALTSIRNWLAMPEKWDNFGVSGVAHTERRKSQSVQDYDNKLRGNNLFGLKTDLIFFADKSSEVREIIRLIENVQQSVRKREKKIAVSMLRQACEDMLKKKY